ncbi:Hypothetical protein D9617_15g043700 [Elsinoe fawcettii]|nr:Hypothetical protein D9617_15g043700 [Elsinoe fawcettii]
MTSGNFDDPPANSITLRQNVQTRLSRLQRTLERTREETTSQAEAARHERWNAYPGQRRRRGYIRPAGPHSPTWEGRGWPRSDESDEDERPRHAKRRKLDQHTHTADEKSYKYGHYGQVEAGRLKMELCSCDGGVHEDNGRSVYYGPSNILRHDQSVYCSRSPSCNIIIRHHDNSAFCLEKLYILGPETGFTSPVRHGTVCVGMGLDELMPLAAESLLYNTLDDEESPSEDEGEEQLSLLESLRDPEIARTIRPRQRDEDWGQAPYPFPYPLPPAQNTSNRDGRIWSNPTDFAWPPLEPERLSGPTVAGGSTANDGWRLTTRPRPTTTLESGMQVSFDSEDLHWPEEPTTPAVLDDRRRRREMRDAALDSDDGTSNYQDRRFRSFQRLHRGIRTRQVPRFPQIDSPRPGSTQVGTGRAGGFNPSGTHQRDATAGSSSHAGSSRLQNEVTRVKFTMEHRKSKVTIRA